MSIYQKASLVQIPSGYKAADDKLYSVVPANGDGDFTVSVDADATRVNADGLIENVVADQARLNYNFIDGVVQPDPHLLLEPTRTNQFTNSENLSNIDFQTNSTITTDNIIAPNGSLTADKTTQTIGGYLRETVSVTNGTTYSFSVFLKKGDLRYAVLRSLFSQNGVTPANSNCIFDLDSGSVVYTGTDVVSASIEAYKDDWYRCSFVSVASTTSSANFIDFYFTSSSSSTQSSGAAGFGYAWGMQLEAGTYATSYIPTTTAAVTRTADTCKLENFANMPTDYPFTVFWQGRIDDINFSQFAFSILDISSNVKYLGLSFSTTNYFQIHRRNSNYDIDNQTFSMSVGDVLKIAIAFTSNTTYKCYINGSLIRNETSGDDVDFDFNDILIGQQRVVSDSATRNQAKQFMVFNEALSDSELEEITSYKSFGQMAKALLYTIE